jgi:hypothetical protein
MGTVVTWGGALLLMFKGYAVIGTFACLLLLPFLALSALFDGALRFTNGLISTIIVTKLAGIPLALFILKGSEALSQTVPALNDPLGQTVCIGFGLFCAWAVQFGLFWACLKVVSPVTGRIYSRGKTRAHVTSGKLRAETTEKRRRRRHGDYSNSFLDRRGSHGRQSERTTGTKARSAGIKAGATLLAKRYPQTAIALKAASAAGKARSAASRAVTAPQDPRGTTGSKGLQSTSSQNGRKGGRSA